MNQDAEAILEQETNLGLRVWQLLFLCLGAVLGVIIMFCCCIRFRIPRTKQEIEADYRRKKLTRKFRERLDCLNNTEIDDMDLMKALERVREEFLVEMQRTKRKDVDGKADNNSINGV
ncbi:transmembrane inner ear expressed protein [Wyeomyia smithii]|uniref:transmembrane inner ear expressed protein n=1 Tax=Wyeomyia smithii TaxID=174621 RepID=UPI002467C3EF|nr:transmembrane inner ear expressed protein [Wyeomyia smithii]